MACSAAVSKLLCNILSCASMLDISMFLKAGSAFDLSVVIRSARAQTALGYGTPATGA